jgi:hypothetical protein
MPRKNPYLIELAEAEKTKLERRHRNIRYRIFM